MIKQTLKGFKEVTNFISKLPRGTKVVAMRAAAEYFIGNSLRGLKHEPKYKYVSRARAYGKVSDAPAGYFSWNQFRYVAAITDGFTKSYNRTHKISNAWKVNEKNSDWSTVNLENNAEGAEFVYGGARQPALVGWRAVAEIITSNFNGAIRAAQKAVDDLISRRNS